MTTAILLAVAALALMVLEVFFVSFGAMTLGAVGCAFGSVMLSFDHSSAMGWSMVAILVAGGPFCIWGAFKLLPHLPFGNRVILSKPDMTTAERRAAAPEPRELLGRVGEATSPLRPSGTALVDGEPYSVVVKGGMLEPGARIRIVDVTGNRIVVEPA